MKKYILDFKKLISNPFVQKWFFTLLAIFAVFILCFMLYTRNMFEKAFIEEYTNYSELQTKRIGAALDDYFYGYNRIASLLSINSTIRIYLFSEEANELFPDLYSQIESQLLSYKDSLRAIDSIYLFPSYENEVFSSGSPQPIALSQFYDTTCLSPAEAPSELSFVPRKKNDRYPYLMTIYMPSYASKTLSSKKGMIAVNIDIAQIPTLLDNSEEIAQSVYIVSDDGKLLYRKAQENMPEPIDTLVELCHFDNSVDCLSKYVNSRQPYVYMQQHSSQYPWYYITVTPLRDYAVSAFKEPKSSLTSLLTWMVLFSLIIIIGLVLYATHPMRTIADFLKNPIKKVPDNITESETRDIIRQILNYIQLNTSLTDELNHQLEQQNKTTLIALQTQINPHFLFNTLNMIRNAELEALGYNHEIPKITLNVSRLLQYALSSPELVPLKTELYYTDLYLRILNQRYQNKLQCKIKKAFDISEFSVPKMILQPIIENAVFHGCAPQLDTGNQIIIDAQLIESKCVILIQDDGIGIDEDTLTGLLQKLSDYKNIPIDSIGLQNVILRMYLVYGEEFYFHIDSAPGLGTCITLSFPAI